MSKHKNTYMYTWQIVWNPFDIEDIVTRGNVKRLSAKNCNEKRQKLISFKLLDFPTKTDWKDNVSVSTHTARDKYSGMVTS